MNTRRIPIILVTTISLLLLTGCGDKTPVDTYTETVDETKQVQEEMDQYTEDLNNETYLEEQETSP